MKYGWEISANTFNAVSILLAGRNSVHTWWTGIIGCLLFAYVYFGTKLYADVSLQLFFIATTIYGWWNWIHGNHGKELPVKKTQPTLIAVLAFAGISITLVYGWLLHHFTDAYAPFLDSIMLAFSILGQFFLMNRNIETWWCWLLVNTVAVPLYFVRSLYVTSILYAVFWLNALVSFLHWHKIMRKQ